MERSLTTLADIIPFRGGDLRSLVGINSVWDREVNDWIDALAIQIFWLAHLGFRIGKGLVSATSLPLSAII